MNEVELRKLISTLIGLHGWSKRHSADEAGLNRSNVAAWLQGREQFLSEANQFKLLETLGVAYGTLTSQIVHRWSVKENIEDVRYVLSTLVKDGIQTAVLYELEQSHDVVIKIPGDPTPVWILITRPLMSSRPTRITGDSIGISICYSISPIIWHQASQGSVLSTALMSEIFTPANESPLSKLARESSPLTATFDKQFGSPPPLVGDEEEDQAFAMSVEQQKKWSKVMLDALEQGISFKNAVNRTRVALDLVPTRSRK